MSRANPRYRRTNPPLFAIGSPGALYVVQVFGLIDNQIWYTNFAYSSPGNPASGPFTSESNIATGWITANAVLLRACMANDVLLQGVKVTCVSQPQRMPAINTTQSGVGFGTGGPTHLNSELAGIIFKYTNFRGQHGRGRNYIPGVPTLFVTPGTDANRMNATGLTAYGQLTQALVINNNISDGTNNVILCVVTRAKPPTPTTLFATATVVGTRALLGTVRRRRIGRGK